MVCKKKVKRRGELLVYAVLMLVSAAFFASFAFGVHTSSPSALSINQSQNYFFNITVNNTNIADAGNVTQINITLPSGFSYVSNTNGTNVFGSFVNASAILSWTNTSNFLINGSANNTYFWFNASITSTLASGYYNVSINSLNGTAVYQTNISIKINDIYAPRVTLLSPTDENSTMFASEPVNFVFNVSDSSATNCTFILDGIVSGFNASVNLTGANTIFINSSYAVSHTWSVNCTDADNNINSSIRTFSFQSFQLNGTAKDEDGNVLNNSIVNVTIRNLLGWNALAYTSGTSNASGWFNFAVAFNDSWMYESAILHRDANNSVDFKSKAVPAFPRQMMIMLAGTTYYLAPAGTMNITAINVSGGRIPFQYQVKDTALGYPVAEDHTNWRTEAVVYVPRNRNYSIMIYPNQSMPVSFSWNNFSSSSSYNFNYSSRYNATTHTVHKQFNTSMTMPSVSGYLPNVSSLSWTNFTVIPYLLEPGNMVHSQYGAMPYNLSNAIGGTDTFNLTSGWYNISLPGTAETSNILLFAVAIENNSRYYGGFRNISLSFGTSSLYLNFTAYGLLGNSGNITLDRIDGAGQNIVIPVAKQTFNLINATNSTLTQTSAHVETTIDYSAYGSLQFTWMSDIQQSQALANFAIPMLNITGIKEMNVFANGGPSGGNAQYAPTRISTKTSAQVNSNNNLTIKTFNPQALDGSSGSGISIVLYKSNSTCDIPNPSSSCALTSASGDMSSFNPMQAVMGGGKISFRMGIGNILVHYVNVDLLASGPPDALFDSAANTSGTTSSSFAAALRFGSQGPTIYDYVLTSIPYSETAGSGLNESAQINISIPTFYDDNWNIIWNVSANGTNPVALAGNYSHYSAYQSAWGNLTQTKICVNATILSYEQINETNPCYVDTSGNKIWIRLPHFSGTGPKISGSVVASTSTTTSSSSSGGTGTATTSFWTNTYSYTETELADRGEIVKLLKAKERINVKVGGSTHSVGIISVAGGKATINVSSTPQQVVLGVNESAKFELTNDNVYDLQVTLDSISIVSNTTKASVTLKAISEAIPSQPSTTTATPPTSGTSGYTSGVSGRMSPPPIEKKPSIGWIIGIIVIGILLIIVLVKSYRRNKKLQKK